MGVYIKNMEIPPNCCECPVNWKVCNRGYEYLLKHPKLYDQRANDCPIIEVPPHGDLIDRAVFREDMDKHYPFDRYTQRQHGLEDAAKTTIIQMLADAPIIIQAEDGDLVKNTGKSKDIHKITNATWIRNLTDEELAKYLSAIFAPYFSRGREYWLDWLKQEVDANDS